MQRKNLIDLPNDVLQLIVHSLAVDSLFAPRYTDNDFGYFGGLSFYTQKCEEYYGKDRDEQDKCALGLLSWSVSCKHFRKFLTPTLFNTIVLRDTPKSIASVKSLSESAYWNDVQSLVFATTSDSSKPRVSGGEDGDENEDYDRDEDAETSNIDEDLFLILSRLPPNLQCLTLDLPEGGDLEVFDEALTDSIPQDCDSETNPYRLMLRQILASISTNDFSIKSACELRLHNIPPYHSLAYEMNSWKSLMSSITSFTLNLKSYDNGAGWRMNVHEPAVDFAAALGRYFWDHCNRLQSFNLHCDWSWPLGAPEDLQHPLELPLPSTRALRNLRNVSFKETFICTPLIKFLQAHLSTLETIELIDCFAPGVSYEDDDIKHESWSTLFIALVDTEPRKLRDVKISYISRSEDHLIDGYHPSPDDAEQRDKVRETLRQQEEDLKQIEDRTERMCTEQCQQRLLAYCEVDDKYGMIFDQAEMVVDNFLEGENHKEWLRLVDIMQRNRASMDSSGDNNV